MPVTAKLSSKFYERFGDEIAAEFVDWFNSVDADYRNQLREVNDLNWERFKAELGAFEARLRLEFQTGLANLRSEMRAEFRAEIGGLRSELHKEIGGLQSELHKEIGGLQSELHKEIGSLRSELHTEIGSVREDLADFRTELLKWMFIYWTGAVVTLGGLTIALSGRH